jgi:sugar lactone lactonase YvrE
MNSELCLQRVGVDVDVLGESPVWDERAQVLWWVDVRAPAIRRHVPRNGTTESFPMPELAGSIALREAGGLVIALASAIACFDPDAKALDRIAAPEAGIAHRRFNDGRCDRQGRFWAGTMQDVTRAPEGTLYRLDASRACTPVLDGIRTPNSLAWSPDGTTMYFADSYLQTIFAYAFDRETGALGERHVFARLDGARMPDGSTVDAEGCLWNAEYDGWRLTRYAPDGRVDRTVMLPVQRPTSCAFGGEDFGVLYVTTASQKLTDAERASQPLAGALLALDVGVRGLPEPRYGG